LNIGIGGSPVVSVALFGGQILDNAVKKDGKLGLAFGIYQRGILPLIKVDFLLVFDLDFDTTVAGSDFKLDLVLVFGAFFVRLACGTGGLDFVLFAACSLLEMNGYRIGVRTGLAIALFLVLALLGQRHWRVIHFGHIGVSLQSSHGSRAAAVALDAGNQYKRQEEFHV